jgi:hypothetical protein
VLLTPLSADALRSSAKFLVFISTVFDAWVVAQGRASVKWAVCNRVRKWFS